MANPPISIGAFDNVPAPLSPIASAWPQAITPRVVHYFATVAERAADWPAPPDAALSHTAELGYTEQYIQGAWTPLSRPVNLAPAYSAPGGTGSGGALRPGEQSRLARYTIPYATGARFWHQTLMSAGGATPANGSMFLYHVGTGATLFTVFFGLPAGHQNATVNLAGKFVGGLGAADLIDLLVRNEPTSTGELQWPVDQTMNVGWAQLNAVGQGPVAERLPA